MIIITSLLFDKYWFLCINLAENFDLNYRIYCDMDNKDYTLYFEVFSSVVGKGCHIKTNESFLDEGILSLKL